MLSQLKIRVNPGRLVFPPMNSARKPLDATAVTVMVLLCLIWGLGQVSVKLATEGVSLVTQAAIRSAIATVLLMLWAGWRGIELFGRDGTLGAGIVAGLLFAAEFVFLFLGLAWTDAARIVIFIYLAPCLSAVGLAWFVPGERLGMRQWAGVLLAFGGLALAFADGFTSARSTLLGDLFGLLAGAFWAATTVVIRATKLTSISASKALFYQLAVSIPVLAVMAAVLGEPGVTRLTPVVVASLFYQAVVVAFISYLAWFWLLTKYLAARLSVFSFLTPLFGVAAGVMILNEPITPVFFAAALLVGAGIYLVNAPGQK
jgi:drug/metabolite transporter (DMT)-like permease